MEELLATDGVEALFARDGLEEFLATDEILIEH
jgi:hypothetical protein